jgi:prohibitin 2
MAFDWDDSDDRRCFKNVSFGGVATVLLVLAASLLGTSLKRLESTGACAPPSSQTAPHRRAPPPRGFLTLYTYPLSLHVQSTASRTTGTPRPWRTRPCRAAFTPDPRASFFIKFPSTQISADINDATCVSKDGLRVKFGVSFQYQLPREWVKPVVVKYRDMDKWASIVRAAGMSAVQHSCSKYLTVAFQNKRGIIQGEMESKLRIKLEGPDGDGAGGVYARAISLQLTNVELPEEYREAVSEKQQADEDIELAKNQRTQETTKANTELLAAAEEAKKINNTATNEADVITIEATEKATEVTYAFGIEKALYTKIKADNELHG